MKKTLCILYYILMALPIPISMFTWIGTLISMANIDIMGEAGIIGSIHRIVASLSMLLAGTYLVSYAYSLYKISKVRRATFTLLLPILHIVVTGICIYFWSCFDRM